MYNQPTEEDLKMFECLDCSVNTMFIDEYYSVTNELWLQAHPDDDGMLCIGCLEKRLDRRLKPEDFPECRVNHSDRFFRSVRLQSRITGA